MSIRKATGAALCALLGMSVAWPAAGEQTVKIGLILPKSGPFAGYGRQIENGVRLYLKQHGDTFAGRKVELLVKDDTGVAPEIKDKLFQPFFTTKPTGEGTGLGLSISYDIVTQQHGGTIEVDSRVGEFTEFTVRLPRAFWATMAEAAS